MIKVQDLIEQLTKLEDCQDYDVCIIGYDGSTPLKGVEINEKESEIELHGY